MDVSIVIPVRNEAAHIEACLRGVMSQHTSMGIETIVIDSGSTDGTPEIAARFANVRLIHQTEADFGHGKTRNLGARLSQGKWVVFLNGDAEPDGRYWLESLVRPLRRDNSLAGVFSRHLPREECPQYMQRDLMRAFPPGEGILLKPEASVNAISFSTVSAAMPRAIWKAFPFSDTIAIAEDVEWAQRTLAAGYPILYEPRSRVFHSHLYSPRQIFRLKRAISRATPRFSNRVSALFLGLPLCAGGGLARIAADILFILRHRQPNHPIHVEIARSLAARIFSFSGRFSGWLSAAGHSDSRR